MQGLRRLILAALVLTFTQGCAMKELKKRNSELEELNANQATAVAELKKREAALQKDLDHWKTRYDDERQINENLQKQLERQQNEKSKLEGDLERLAKEIDGARTRQSAEGTHLVLDQSILFEPGKNDISSRGKSALAKVAAFLKARPGILRIDGHTDSDPITHSAWENNHHLGAARALAVLRELKGLGVSEGRMFITSFAANRSVAPNDTKANKARNRRTELLLIEAIPDYWTPDGKPQGAPKAEAPKPAPAPKVTAPAPPPATPKKKDDVIVPK